MSLFYKGKLIPLAKELRKNMTRQERHLWYDFLRCYPIRFQRQKTIGNYIVDFYCHSARLVIELDGSQHYFEDGIGKDKERDEFFNKLGLKVLRFSNREIDEDFKGVCECIDLTIKGKLNK